jgi:hypothetical protein
MNADRGHIEVPQWQNQANNIAHRLGHDNIPNQSCDTSPLR